MEQPHGLIFDVDGVIADTEPVNARASIRVFEEMFQLKGVRRKDFEAGLGRGAENYMIAAATVHGLNLTDQQVEASALLREKYILEILRTEPLPAFPGVLPLMEAGLARDDFRLAIATSSSHELCHAMLAAAGVPYDKLTRVTGSDVTHKKPHPELFLKAAQSIDLPPNRCMVIEDAPNGVEAAHAAGCKVIAVTNSAAPEKLADADRIVDSLEQINPDTITSLLSAS